ncbi:GvpL/GvpF family gas vesicle protein [Bacillus sp. USDA818B3_A]|uniref:GvpL/GvpF family gas vesicle protein n=1 Tax=Bacillus sp. USDA818B3_A TaxID=2698834 RepID=UPI001369AA9C|nr:GvpL/GvpF family gas vesicle protein [Bacillus sp. USDA818B3_A]
MNAKGGVYVFGIIQETQEEQFGKAKLNGLDRKIYPLHYKQLTAVVARVNGEVLPQRNNLTAHKQTVMDLMKKKYTVIPMSFGNVLHSEKNVLLIMEHLYEELEKLMSQLENKIEVGLKVIPKKQWIDEELKKDSILEHLKDSPKDISKPANYYKKIEIGERAKDFVLQLEREVEKEIYSPLLEMAEAGKQNDMVPGKMLLNAAYLIDSEKEELFDKRVNELYEVWKERADFKYSGPWPAYNFVNIRLKIEEKS